jgi:signal peptidase II
MAEVAPAGAPEPQAAPPAWAAWFTPPLLVVLAADQATKHWVFAQPASSLPWWIDPSTNQGVAWGKFHAWPTAVLILTLVLIPVLGFIHWRWFRHAGRCENLAFGLILGGALGNAWDRVLTAAGAHGYQGVRDFVRVDLKPIGIDYVWPTFNVADAGISIGFAVLVLLAALRPAKT